MNNNFTKAVASVAVTGGVVVSLMITGNPNVLWALLVIVLIVKD